MSRLLCAFLIPLLSLACAADEQQGTPDEAARSAASAYCDALFSCECGDYPYPDAQACTEATNAELAGYLAAGTQAGLTFDADCFGENAEIGADPCGSGYTEYVEPESCTYCSEFHGSVGLGQPCTVHGYFDDCARGTLCEDGVCKDPCAPVGLGEPCTTSIEQSPCAAGLRCSWESNTCVTERQVGDPCEPGANDCIEGTACGVSVVCERLPALGEPCPDFYCSEGECIQGTCAPPSPEGGPCEFSTHCEAMLYCDIGDDFSGICVPTLAAGEPCSSYDDCQSFECGADGTCQPAIPWICG